MKEQCRYINNAVKFYNNKRILPTNVHENDVTHLIIGFSRNNPCSPTEEVYNTSPHIP